MQRFHHRRLRQLVSLATACLLLQGGCLGFNWWRRCDHCECSVANAVAPQRRIFVFVPPCGVPEHELFVEEILAALKRTGQCEVVFLGGQGLSSPGEFAPAELAVLLDPINWPPVYPIPDTVLVVDVKELAPCRPMRLSADLELRHASGGPALYHATRTWDAPQDDAPLPPHPFNRKVLNHPLPPGVQEHLELSRVSPRRFMSNIADEVAHEILATPL